MQKVRNAELSFLYATLCLVLSYISTKYHKNIPKGLWLQSRHKINGVSLSNITNGDNTKSKKGRVVILVPDTLSGPVLHIYQVSSKYSKGYSSYRADKKSDADADANGLHPKNNMTPPLGGWGGGGDINMFLFFSENRLWSTNLNECHSLFSGKNKKYFKISSAEIYIKHAECSDHKHYWDRKDTKIPGWFYA